MSDWTVGQREKRKLTGIFWSDEREGAHSELKKHLYWLIEGKPIKDGIQYWPTSQTKNMFSIHTKSSVKSVTL